MAGRSQPFPRAVYGELVRLRNPVFALFTVAGPSTDCLTGLDRAAARPEARPVTGSGVLSVVSDVALRDEVDRVAAAAGLRVVHCGAAGPSGRRAWSAAAAVVLDADGARTCAGRSLPRRPHVFVVTLEPTAQTWQSAVSVGAQQVLELPREEARFVSAISDAADTSGTETDAGRRSGVVCVVGARGGAGASTFAAGLALTAGDALLVDVDPWSGGLDLLLGIERRPGLRWPDLELEGGRLPLSALRDALPRYAEVAVVSTTRAGREIHDGAVGAIADAGRRGGATVVFDVPRRLTPAAETALDTADLVILLATADVRCAASTAAMATVLSARNPNAGLVVRGPSPGGLRGADVAAVSGLPLLATMRAAPGLADRVDLGKGPALSRRSPLAVAARRVLGVLQRQPAAVAA